MHVGGCWYPAGFRWCLLLRRMGVISVEVVRSSLQRGVVFNFYAAHVGLRPRDMKMWSTLGSCGDMSVGLTSSARGHLCNHW
jgi:hypothetical protein